MEIVLVVVLIAAAIGVVIRPLLRKDAGAPDPVDVGSAANPEGLTMPEIEGEVARYRRALRAGTVCARCTQANPPGSRFCSDCGKPLPLAREQSAVPTATT